MNYLNYLLLVLETARAKTGARAGSSIGVSEISARESLLLMSTFRWLPASLLLPGLTEGGFQYGLQQGQMSEIISTASVVHVTKNSFKQTGWPVGFRAFRIVINQLNKKTKILGWHGKYLMWIEDKLSIDTM